MNVLVIGGTGFLSSALVRISRDVGHQVCIVTRGRSQNLVPEGVETLVADRSEPDSLRAAVGDRVFDLVLDSILFRPDDARAAVDIFHKRAGRYVFISTDFVYGGEPRAFPVTEDAPRQSLSRYGRDKAACEDLLREAWETGQFPAVTLRPPHILGAGCLLGTGSLQGRDPWLLWRLREAMPLLLLDGGALLIQPVHRDDIARACLAVAVSDAANGRAYNISGPDCVTTRRYYELVTEIIGVPLPVVLSLPSAAYVTAFPDRASFTLNRAYSLQRLVDDAGFAPSVSLRDALAEVIAALEAKGLPDVPPPEDNAALLDLLRGHTGAVAALLRPENT